MGRPKKGEKTPGSGRQKGTPNKSTQNLLEICEEEGIEPFRAMLRELSGLDIAKERFDALEKICQYLYPKRKAIEMDLDPENKGLRIIIEDYSGKK